MYRRYRLAYIDQRLFLWLSGLCRYRVLLRAARMVSRTGDGHLQVVVLLCLALSFPGKTLALAKIMALTFACERSIYWVLKNTIKRKRPTDAIRTFKATIVASDEFSFPSGHTCAAFLLLSLGTALAPFLFLPLLIWAAMVGASRVILGVHFPADIIAGMALGLSIGYVCSPFLVGIAFV